MSSTDSTLHTLILAWWQEGWQLSIQVTVLTVLVLLVTRISRGLEPRFRYLLWLLVLLRLLVPFAVISPIGLLPGDALESSLDDHPPAATWAPSAQGGLSPYTRLDDNVSWLATQQRVELVSLPSMAFASWLGGMLLLTLGLLHRLHRVKTALRSCPPAPARLCHLVARLQQDLKMRRRVQIVLARSGSELDAPALFGLFEPTILLPEDMAERWTVAEIEPVLLHELVHLKRADPWIHALQVALQIVYFFHPLVWLANRQLRLEREMACDDRVVELSAGCPRRYMAALLAVASRQRSPQRSWHRWQPVLGMSLRPSLLARRLRRLHAPSPRPGKIPTVLAVLAGLSALGIASDRDPARWALDAVPVKPNLVSMPGIEENPQLILTWIDQHPTADETRTVQQLLHPKIDPDNHRKAAASWQRHLESHPGNPAILGNAGAFFGSSEPGLAEELLLRAAALEPQNPIWHSLLAELYRKAPGRQLEALIHRESALLSTHDILAQIPILFELPDAAFAAGDLEKAHQYARQLLAAVPSLDGDWRQGNALHRGHLTLGRLALRSGQVELAEQYLLRAIEVRSPQLRSFGPKMDLARELLQSGENEIVLRFFKACAAFWKSGAARLQHWTEAVERGEIPDFSWRPDC